MTKEIGVGNVWMNETAGFLYRNRPSGQPDYNKDLPSAVWQGMIGIDISEYAEDNDRHNQRHVLLVTEASTLDLSERGIDRFVYVSVAIEGLKLTEGFRRRQQGRQGGFEESSDVKGAVKRTGDELGIFLEGGPLIYRGKPEDLERSVIDPREFNK